jgi:sulfite reductase alpha subunit-like flavoprotein
MTDEQRLDRMERIVKLLIKAGLRARQQTREQAREQNEKINILIDSQIKTDERLAALSAKTDERFAEMAVAQASTEKQLTSLAATVEWVINERRNGQP